MWGVIVEICNYHLQHSVCDVFEAREITKGFLKTMKDFQYGVWSRRMVKTVTRLLFM